MSADRGRAVTIANECLELEVDPQLGGKVVALRCREHDRQWLAERLAGLERAPGDPPYGPAEAWGWDELFPSVLPGAGAPPPWTEPLRDHGELWGRPWEVFEQSERTLGLVYESAEPGFAFERLLALEGRSVHCGYVLRSRSERPLPFQWSMHPIFALRPGERINLPGVDRVRASAGNPPLPAVSEWPVHGGLDLGAVRESDGETILKLYATLPEPAVTVSGEPCELRVKTDPRFAPAVGIYVNFGGWPAAGPLHQVGIEPTNSPEDDLTTAIGAGQAGELGAGEILKWEVELQLGERCQRERR